MAIALASAAQAYAPDNVRVALVIGNSAYLSSPLVNPANDAKAMSETLRGLGFKVIELRDGSKAQMAEAIDKVRDSLKGNEGVGMLYYAGHGLQLDARNYMVPVDANLSKPADVVQQTVDVNGVIDAFKAAGNRMNILVLDSCRDNPFGGITTGKGLAPLDAPSGTFLAYATAPGNVAEDGDVKSGNGLYTQYLLQELKSPQARIEDVFKRVRFAVRKASNNRQIPWESTSLEEDFQFNDGHIVPTPKPDAQKLQASFNEEKQLWDRIKDSSNPDDFYAFLQQYPSGTITEAVHNKLNQLTKSRMMVQGAGADGKDQAYTVSKFRLGDVYELSHTSQSSSTPPKTNKEVYRVLKVERSRIEVEFEVSGSRSIMVYDENGGKISQGDMQFDPPQTFVPGGLLQVGRNWTIASQITQGNGAQTQFINQGHIAARERITVPAGAFDTYRIERTSTDNNKDGKPSGGKTTCWMTPDLPIPIRQEFSVYSPYGEVKAKEELTRIVRGSYTSTTVSAPVQQSSPPTVAPASADREVLFWEGVKDSPDAAGYELYLEKYPQGEFAKLAQLKIKQLTGKGRSEKAAWQAEPAPSATTTASDIGKEHSAQTISVAISLRDADMASSISPHKAIDFAKERFESFGYQAWEGGASERQVADFSVIAEVKFKFTSLVLQASKLKVTTYSLTSWTVKCINNHTGEEIYSNNQIPKSKSWPDENQALEAIGRQIGGEFSTAFFDQHLLKSGNRL